MERTGTEGGKARATTARGLPAGLLALGTAVLSVVLLVDHDDPAPATSRADAAGERRSHPTTSTVVPPAVHPEGPIVLRPADDRGGGLVSSSADLEVAALSTGDPRNDRTLFWPSTAAGVADGRSCATWTYQMGDVVQQGAALRIRTGGGRVRAVTVTKNVLRGVNWHFNFHTWDTERAQAFEQFHQAEVRALRWATTTALPWRFCARAMGGTIEFTVWPSGVAEPPWGDPQWSGTAEIPPGFSAPGRTGWFVGHLGPGGEAHFDNLRIGRAEEPAASTRRRSDVDRCPTGPSPDGWCHPGPVVAYG